MLLKLIRRILGQLIVLLNALFPPRKVQRSVEMQQMIDTQTPSLKLYQYAACPFCVKARRAMRRLNLDIETRDALHNAEYRAELLREGGKIQVPCLQITHEDGSRQWLYESSNIIAYLESRFSSEEDLENVYS